MSYYLGIDLGATNLRVAVATEDLTVVGRAEEPTLAGDADLSEQLVALLGRACSDAAVDPAQLAGVAIGSIGPLDRDAGVLVDPPNVPLAGRIDVVGPVREAVGTDSVVLHNDAIAGVIGERHAVDAATEHMVYLTLSTGIGAGVVVDGAVLSGHRGNAAEVGHVTVDPAETMPCGCGGAGHWEAYCSGANIPRYAVTLAREQGVETTLPDDPAAFGAADVFARRGDDDLADLVVERVARWNVLGVATVVHAFAPEYVAVGGAVALNNPDAVLGPIRERVPDRLTVPAPDIALAESGADAVLYGALVSARERAGGD